MNKQQQRLIALVLTAIMSIGLITSCNKNDNLNDADDNEENVVSAVIDPDTGIATISFDELSAKHTYKRESIKIPESLESFSAYAYEENILYICGLEFVDGEMFHGFPVHDVISIYSVNINNGSASRLYSEPRKEKQVRSIVVGQDSSLWILEASSEYELSTEGISTMAEETFRLIKINSRGEIEDTIELDYRTDPQRMFIHDGNFYLQSRWPYTYTVLDTAGNKLTEIDGSQNGFYMVANDEGIFTTSDNSDGFEILKLNTDEWLFESAVTIETEYSGWSIMSYSNDIYIKNNFSTDLYRYDLRTNDVEHLLNFNNLGLFANIAVYPLSGDDLLHCGFNDIYILRVSEHNENIQTLTLATLGGNFSEVANFNTMNDKYTIEVIDYSIYNTVDSSSEGINKLRTEIIAGNVPDIIDLTSVPCDLYENNTLLADLMPFLESDSEFGISDFEPDVLSAMMVGGKLTNFTTMFGTIAVLGNSSDITGNDIESFTDLTAIAGRGGEFHSMIRRSDLVRYTLGASNSKYFDFETGDCYFDTEDFISFLEFANTQPDDLNSIISYTPSESLRFYYMMFSGMPQGTSSYFKEDDIGVAGLPSSDNNGAMIFPFSSFGMTSASNNKDGVWEFFKFLVSDEYLDASGIGTFNIKKTVNDRIVQEHRAMIKLAESNSNNDTALMPKEEDIELFRQLLDSVTGMYRYNEGLYNIVMEDASDYFAGAISAERAAELIQSRASMYMSERR